MGSRFLCDSCSQAIPDVARRIHCEVCPDFDMCATCFKAGRAPPPHKVTHALSHFRQGMPYKPYSNGFICNVCRQRFGPRTERLNCADPVCIEFDLCTTCFNFGKTEGCHSTSHTMQHFPSGNFKKFSPSSTLSPSSPSISSPSPSISSSLSSSTSSPLRPSISSPVVFLCDGCNQVIKSTTMVRYHCTECANYDLCNECNNKKAQTLCHASNHTMQCILPLCTSEIKQMHLKHQCDTCGKFPIIGIRFHCSDTCSDYDLCQDCHVQKKVSKSHTRSHKTVPIFDWQGSNVATLSPANQPQSIQALSGSDSEYQNTSKLFHLKWLKKSSGAPQIVGIFSLVQAKHLVERFKRRQEEINKQCSNTKNSPMAIGPANTLYRFHGPGGQACSLGTSSSNTKICSISGCSTCGIIANGFLLSKCLTNTNWARFGNGLYFTATSSKANDYNKNTGVGLGPGLRAMLVCQVICGSVEILTTEAPHRTAPKSGCHSIVGEPSTHGPLNYDELVVYHEDQVLVDKLIVYRIC